MSGQGTRAASTDRLSRPARRTWPAAQGESALDADAEADPALGGQVATDDA
jgi:hypothetical protein